MLEGERVHRQIRICESAHEPAALLHLGQHIGSHRGGTVGHLVVAVADHRQPVTAELQGIALVPAALGGCAVIAVAVEFRRRGQLRPVAVDLDAVDVRVDLGNRDLETPAEVEELVFELTLGPCEPRDI